MTTTRGRVDTRTLGLDLGLEVMRFLTGREMLHYGLWEADLPVCAANLLVAQEAYSRMLFSLLPERSLDILDIGGGSGETARDLMELGHRVEIVVPSALLAERCRANAGPDAKVHQIRFEEFRSERPFDVCLFSESFQYIDLELALDNALNHLTADGLILISDCFRTEAFGRELAEQALVGGGHSLARFRNELSSRPLEVTFEEDVTKLVAPSIELSQNFYHLVGRVTHRVDSDVALAFPRLRWLLAFLFRNLISKRRRARLERRLYANDRTQEAFCRYNRYLMLRLTPVSTSSDRN